MVHKSKHSDQAAKLVHHTRKPSTLMQRSGRTKSQPKNYVKFNNSGDVHYLRCGHGGAVPPEYLLEEINYLNVEVYT